MLSFAFKLEIRQIIKDLNNSSVIVDYFKIRFEISPLYYN